MSPSTQTPTKPLILSSHPSYLFFLQVADLVLEADEAVLDVTLVALVDGGGGCQGQLERTQSTGGANLGAPLPPLL